MDSATHNTHSAALPPQGDSRWSATRVLALIFSLIISLISSYTGYVLGGEMGPVFAISLPILLLAFSYVIFPLLPPFCLMAALMVSALGGVIFTFFATGGYFAMASSEAKYPDLAEIKDDIRSAEKDLTIARVTQTGYMSTGNFANAALVSRQEIQPLQKELQSLREKKAKFTRGLDKYEYGPLAIFSQLSNLLPISVDTIAALVMIFFTVVFVAFEACLAAIARGCFYQASVLGK